jgi:hypothetical protein
LRAESKLEALRGELGFSQRKVDEAQLGAEDSRRKGLPRHRWEADKRKWQARADLGESDLRRWGDEARSHEKNVKALELEIRDTQADLETRTREVLDLGRRLQRLARLGRGIRVLGRSRSARERAMSAADSSLSITSRATSALQEVLEGLEHQPDQMLRLAMDPSDAIILVVDDARPGDNLVCHDGVPVLLVDGVLPRGLRGKTLDVSESYEGTQIVLTS